MNDPSQVQSLAFELIRRESVTPADAGCQSLLTERLSRLRFQCEQIDFGEVLNLWAWHGEGEPTLVFLGHTDVVPPGPPGQWRSPPFEPTVDGELLRGRGAADMKGAVAAMVCAMERFASENPDHAGRLGLMLTSDEEGIAVDGIKRVVPELTSRGIRIDYCLVGEPSSLERLGDTIRVGRRGSLNGRLTVHGVQGHAAYPDKADNAIHRAAGAVAELVAQQWDQGNEFFPPTSFQISDIQAGVGATNVIPGRLEMAFNFRFCPESSADSLEQRVDEICQAHELKYELSWHLSGEPFFTPDGPLVEAVTRSVAEALGAEPRADTGGGTSDGRFVAPAGAQVVELGLVNATIHQVNESTLLSDMDKLADIYLSVIRKMLKGSA